MKALITGASSGIGRDMARYLSNLGYDLIVVARDKRNLEKLKKELKTECKVICKDLSLKENCIDLYNETKNEDIDILINNAAFGAFGNFAEINLETDINMINTNIVAYSILTKLYLQDMIKKDKGYILNVSSLASFMPGPLMSNYYATKAYITRLSEGIYKELKKSGSKVSISILCPGPVDTNFNTVAHVKFSMKSLSSEYVARYGINKMFKRKLIIIPGFINKCGQVLAKISPDKLAMCVAYKIQKRKRV